MPVPIRFTCWHCQLRLHSFGVLLALALLGSSCRGTTPHAPAGQAAHEVASLAIDWPALRNPFLDDEPRVSYRDPALVYHEGLFYCFYSHVEPRPREGTFFFNLGMTRSRDLARWESPRLLTSSTLNFSSPGNVLRLKDRWVLCVQSYPIPQGKVFADDSARLWLMESTDLVNWSAPCPMNPPGCRARWAKTPRQIDPCLVEHDGRYWCFYKTSGALGLLVSDDLKTWREASPERPVLSRQMTPDGCGMENPCVVRDGEEFVIFFARVGEGRGIGVARSRDLLHWRGIHYLDLPKPAWANNGVTAAMVLDLRPQTGRWLMAFHGDRTNVHAHGGALGLAWSRDLEHWELAGEQQRDEGLGTRD